MKDNDFEYNYSAPTSAERKEIESIRSNYVAKSNKVNKLEYLRKLDFKVKNIPVVLSLVVGTLGTLIFGLGLTMILEWSLLVWGIVVCAVGVVPISVAYFLHNASLNYLKEKYSDEILKISEELLNDDK